VTISVALEVGSTRVFAAALDWPGWCRSARDEDGALRALLEYAPRYAAVLRRKRLAFTLPRDASAFRVAERLPGNATTDFGAPSIISASDSRRMDDRELARQRSVLEASWAAFDAAVAAASGKRLQKGPRGGGRSLAAIGDHVLQADAGYLVRIGGTYRKGDKAIEKDRIRTGILEALSSAPRTGTPPPGPRGGARWPIRYYLRRSAWHVLDHAWEIEDRANL